MFDVRIVVCNKTVIVNTLIVNVDSIKSEYELNINVLQEDFFVQIKD
jgi:hypothetical protein